MAQELPVAHLIRFGPFTADLRSGELYNSGLKLKLRDQSFQVLVLLLEHVGEVVTREQLRQRLWPDEIFVDFDHGLNAAVERLRRSLGDSATSPSLIETLPRRGYRFIGEIDATPSHPVSEIPRETWQEATKEVQQEPIRVERQYPRRDFLLMSIAAVALGLFVYVVVAHRRPAPSAATPVAHQTMLAVLPFENLSAQPNEDYFSDGLTEELITQLGSLSPDRLGVIARTTSMAYKHTSKSAQQIATELSVDYILESSIRRDANQMRITVQLIRARGQVHVWAQSRKK
jgi:TolB-like protein/DNA-binding winged helix-turn-helix (wHTH) protein